MADNRAPPSQPAAMTTPALLDADLIRQHLGSRAAGFDIRVLAECPSTNSALMNAPLSQDGPVPVLVAERQTAGRGHRGREWLAWPGASLTFSVLWRFPAGALAPAGLSLAVGLALADRKSTRLNSSH